MNKPTVTFATSVLNEEQNITFFLESVLLQIEKGFSLKKILIISDGSSDNTVKLIKSIRNKKIKLIENKTRLGKSSRLNQIYALLDTDILVQSDADVILAHPLVIHDLIQPLIKSKKIGMCGGNPTPIAGKSFWEKLVQVVTQPYQEFRSSVRSGSNVFSAIGQLIAYKKDLVKKIKIPENMVINDIFTYFSCLRLGWKYKFVKSAVVYYQSPSNLEDLVKQNFRFQAGYKRLFNYFDKNLIRAEFSIPRLIYLKTILKQTLKYPAYSMTYYFIKLYCSIKAILAGDKLTGKWPIASSTKIRINYEK